jgi:predicted TIM-barrel fold metal-dependent hydrolase
MLYDGPRIDLDVHHRWKADAEVIAYLPTRWRDLVELPGKRTRSLVPPQHWNPAPNGIAYRLDAYPPGGGPPGSDLTTMREQLLEPFNIQAAILSFDVGQHVGLANLELASALTRAMNDWSVEHWLSGQDKRLFGSLLVNTQLPEVGAEEIRRLGGHPRIAEALLVINGAHKPFGHPVYHPIYAAAVEVGIPIAIHIGGEFFIQGLATASQAGGVALTRFERHTTHMQPIQHYLASFVTHGVFEKFPSLRIIIKETGTAWLPWLFWELDACHELLQMESTWVHRKPSEYLREHLFVATQPLEEPPQSSLLVDWFEVAGNLEELICFSTDYPHHDTDDPDHIARRLPPAWWDRVFYKNALRAYGWSESSFRVAQDAKRATSG